MKTYIIQLEAHDDLVSARDKLAWAKARRVILIWPKRGKLLSEYIPLSHLKREGERLGVELGFISSNRLVRENARLLGIPVFESVSQAEKNVWKSGPTRKIDRIPLTGYENLIAQRDAIHPPMAANLPARTAGKVLVFITGLVAVFALVAFFTPSATVRIFPVREEQSIDIGVQVNPSASEVNLAGIIPGKLTKLELSATKMGTSSGTVKVGVAKAEGELTVKNTSDTKVAILQGTRFTTVGGDGKSYLATADVTVDARGGNPASVPVEAENAGDEWNLPTGSEFSVQTVWAGSVNISNATAIAGGISVDSPTPTEADYSALRDRLLSDLKNQAAQTISNQLPEREVLVSSSLQNIEVVSETRSISPGTPSEKFSLEIKVLFTVTSYAKSDLEYLAGSILDANLKPGTKTVAGTLELKDSSATELQESGTYSWEVHADRLIEPAISSESLAQSLVGLETANVQRVLNSIGNFRAPGEVHLRPKWWTRMPFVAFRIAIEEQ